MTPLVCDDQPRADSMFPFFDLAVAGFSNATFELIVRGAAVILQHREQVRLMQNRAS